MNIREFRSRYPEYDDLSDQILSDRLYQRYYSDLPRGEFNRRFGVETPTLGEPSAPETEEPEGLERGLALRGEVKQQLRETVKGVIPAPVSMLGGAFKGLAGLTAPSAAMRMLATELKDAPSYSAEQITDLRRRAGMLTGAERSAFQTALSDVLEGAVEGREATAEYRMPVAGRPMFKTGEAIERAGRAILPAAPGYEESIGRQLGEGLGTSVGGALVSLVPGVGPAVAAAVFGLAGAGEAVDRAVKEGASEDEIREAARLGVIPGLTDVLPVETLTGRIPVPGIGFLKIPLGTLGPALKAVGRVGWQAFIEGVQEGGQKFLQNLIAREVYKPGQALGEGIAPEAGVGAGVGAIAESGRQVLSAMIGRRGAGGPRPLGEAEKARAEIPPVTPADEASPIPTELIAEGRQAMRVAEGERKADDILGRMGLPSTGSRVEIVAADGSRLAGTIKDAFSATDPVLGIADDGVRIGLDDGTTVDETWRNLVASGVKILPAAPLATGVGREVGREAAAVEPAPAFTLRPEPAPAVREAVPTAPVAKEPKRDREAERRLSRRRREGEEPGRPVQKPGPSGAPVEAGRVLQEPVEVERGAGVAPVQGAEPRPSEKVGGPSFEDFTRALPRDESGDADLAGAGARIIEAVAGKAVPWRLMSVSQRRRAEEMARAESAAATPTAPPSEAAPTPSEPALPVSAARVVEPIPYSPDMKIKNLDALPRSSVGGWVGRENYLIAIRGDGDEMVAKQWKRVLPSSVEPGEVLVDFTPSPPVRGWPGREKGRARLAAATPQVAPLAGMTPLGVAPAAPEREAGAAPTAPAGERALIRYKAPEAKDAPQPIVDEGIEGASPRLWEVRYVGVGETETKTAPVSASTAEMAAGLFQNTYKMSKIARVLDISPVSYWVGEPSSELSKGSWIMLSKATGKWRGHINQRQREDVNEDTAEAALRKMREAATEGAAKETAEKERAAAEKAVAAREGQQLVGYFLPEDTERATPRDVTNKSKRRNPSADLVEEGPYVGSREIMFLAEAEPEIAAAVRREIGEAEERKRDVKRAGVDEIWKKSEAGKTPFKALAYQDEKQAEAGQEKVVYGKIGKTWFALDAAYYDYIVNQKGYEIKGHEDPAKHPGAAPGVWDGEKMVGVVAPREVRKDEAELVAATEFLGEPRTGKELRDWLTAPRPEAKPRVTRTTPKAPPIPREARERVKQLETQTFATLDTLRARAARDSEAHQEAIAKEREEVEAAAKKYSTKENEQNKFVEGFYGTISPNKLTPKAAAAGWEYAQKNKRPDSLFYEFDLETARGQKTHYRILADPKAIDTLKAELKKLGSRAFYSIGGERKAGTLEDNRRLAGFERDFKARLKQIGIDDAVSAKLVEAIRSAATGEIVEGATGKYAGRLIEVALAAPDKRWTLDHEIVHALRDLGLIDDKSWEILKDSALGDEKRIEALRKRRPDLGDDALAEEAVADMFADWARGKREAKGPLAKALSAIKDFLNALRNALRLRGFTTAEKIMGRIERGEMGGRTAEGPVALLDQPGPMGISEQFSASESERAGKLQNFFDAVKAAAAEKFSLGGPAPTTATKTKLVQLAKQARFGSIDAEARFQDARHGLKSTEVLIARASAWWDYLKAGFARHHIAMPNEPRFADDLQWLRTLEQAPLYAKTRVLEILRSLVGKMTNEEFEIFTRKVILDDLAYEVEQGHELPFGLSDADVKAELGKLETILDSLPSIRNAVRRRKVIVRHLADEMVRAGVLTGEQVKNPAYYRHQVLDYARAWGEVSRAYLKGTGKKLRTPYWMRRKGSVRDINANLLEAELDWMYKALTDIKAAETIQKIKDKYAPIIEDAKRDARAYNTKVLGGLIEKDRATNGYTDKKGRQRSPLEDELKAFGQRIAMGFDELGKITKKGMLEWPAEFDHVVEQIRDSIEKREAEAADEVPVAERTRIGADEDMLPFLSWILDHGKPGARAAATIFKAISGRKAWVENTLGKDYVDPLSIEALVNRKFAPENHSVWQPASADGRHTAFQFFTAKTLPEHVIDKFIARVAQESAGPISAEEMRGARESVRDVLAIGGPKYQMILPTELADTLNNLRDEHADQLVEFFLERPLRMWKRWVLINPRRVLKYNLNNLSGDLDGVIAGNPRALRRTGEAIKELWQVMRGAAPSERMRQALERGAIDSGFRIHEVPDINELAEFSGLIERPSPLHPARFAVSSLKKIWKGLEDYTQFRENWLRYAAWLDYADRIEAGEGMKSIGYGASNPKMIDAISDPLDKAAALTRDLIGDYGNISYFGRQIRRKLIPFWSWAEINTKRYWRLGGNAFSQGLGRGLATGTFLGATVGTRVTAHLFLRMAVVYGLVALWNELVFGDEEDELSDQEQLRLHIILGRDDAGNVRTLRFQGALSDFLGWIGFEDAIHAIREIERGRGDWSDVATAVTKAPINRVLNGLTPVVDLAATAAGYRLFPEPFRPQPIQDPWREAFKTFSLENEFDVAFGRPTRGYGRSVEETLTYKRDAGENAYNRIKGMVHEWQRRERGVEGVSSFSTPRSRTLYEWRLAQRYGDREAEEKAMDKLAELGVDSSALRASLRRAHPLGALAIKDRRAFLDTLDAKERRLLDKGIDWYEETFLQ